MTYRKIEDYSNLMWLIKFFILSNMLDKNETGEF